MDLFGLHIPEQGVSPHRLGHKVGRSQQLPQGLGLRLPGVEQIGAGVQDADDVVGVLLVDREPGQAGLPDGADNLLVAVLGPEHDHVGAVNHDLLGGHVVELEDVVNHLLLARLNGPLLLADVHHHADLLLGDLILLGVGVNM